MKTWKKLTIAGAAAALIGGTALVGGAYADPSSDDDHDGMGFTRMMGGMGPMMMGGMGPMGRAGPRGMLQKLDLDGDGKITRKEALEAPAKELEKYDTDGDGKLTVGEYEQAWLDYSRPMMVRRFQMHDTDADGRVTAEEFGAVVERMFWRMDRNGDGVIEPAEMRRMGKGRKERHEYRRYRDDD